MRPTGTQPRRDPTISSAWIFPLNVASRAPPITRHRRRTRRHRQPQAMETPQRTATVPSASGMSPAGHTANIDPMRTPVLLEARNGWPAKSVVRKQEAAMDRETATDTQQSSAPGTLEKFHLGLAADGTTCALVFVDERHRSIACIASYADLNGFIMSLTRAATEMARRRAMLMQDDAIATEDDIMA